MDVEMASWKSTGTYVDAVPPPGANIVSGMWIFRVKRPPGSPPVFKARYVARGFTQRQGVDYFQTFSPTLKMTTLRVLLHVAAHRDYELHSLDFSTAFLQGSLHEEIWLRRPLGFTGTFPPGTQWSLRRPVYGLRQAPREWHDTLRTTLAALGFAPSTADPSLFLRTDTSLPPFYILVYVDDLVFAIADTAGLSHVKARRTIALTQSHMVQQVLQRFGFTYSSPQATPLPTRHSLSALPSDESVESSGPYPELVGCLITSGMGLVLGGRSPVVLTGHADASWADDQATQRSSQGYTFSLGSGSVSWRATRSSSVLGSSCEAEIYAGAMAAQELRWLTYLLTGLGEPPRSPPVLYVDNKAMLALCREQRLEHRTKHIALRYFLARELQQRGQLRLAYVASEANIADVFTKALAPCDHQRFCTQLACFALLCLTGLAMKSTRQRPAGLLQPLEPPERPWQQVTMDFVTGMPARPSGNDAVLVVVDRLTKMAHFAPCRTTITAEETERLFISTVVRLHGIPSAIISDRDPKFTSKFWKETWAQYGTKLQFSSTYHPQTNGQTERTNQTMEQLIRTNCPDPARWEDSLAMLEFAFNNAPSSTTNHSPFFLNYGMDPMVPTTTTLDNLVPRSQTFVTELQAVREKSGDAIRKANTTSRKYTDLFRRELVLTARQLFVPATTDIARQQVAPTARPVPEPTLDPSKILAHRVRLDAAGRHVDFLIRWNDRTSEDDTWVSSASLADSPFVVDYLARKRTADIDHLA
ncbi:unnamed protein product [Closterium sp. NIES-53]